MKGLWKNEDNFNFMISILINTLNDIIIVNNNVDE